MSTHPSATAIISADIAVRNGMIQITDGIQGAPLKSTKVMKANGLLSFRALSKYAGQQATDVLDYGR